MHQSFDEGPGGDHDAPYRYDPFFADVARQVFLWHLLATAAVTDFPGEPDRQSAFAAVDLTISGLARSVDPAIPGRARDAVRRVPVVEEP